MTTTSRSDIIGTRYRLIHGYDSVDHNILWDIVTTDLPSLGLQIQAILPQKWARGEPTIATN